jgi:hypothetical protein
MWAVKVDDVPRLDKKMLAFASKGSARCDGAGMKVWRR